MFLFAVLADNIQQTSFPTKFVILFSHDNLSLMLWVKPGFCCLCPHFSMSTLTAELSLQLLARFFMVFLIIFLPDFLSWTLNKTIKVEVGIEHIGGISHISCLILYECTTYCDWLIKFRHPDGLITTKPIASIFVMQAMNIRA